MPAAIEERTAKTLPFGLDRCCWDAAAELHAQCSVGKHNVSRARESGLEVFADSTKADIADDESDQSIASFLHSFSGLQTFYTLQDICMRGP